MGISCNFVDTRAFALNGNQLKKIKRISLAFMVILGVMLTASTVSHAEKELTDLFYTTAFTGSWEVFSKYNFVGKIMNFLISTFCLFGLMLTVFSFTITLLYKSNEPIFDQIYELKKGAKGQKFFGVVAMGKEIFNGNYGVGADAFIGFLLSLCPNVKAYSHYNPDKMAYNLAEDDTITTYVLKMSIPTIMTIFFFAIGFNGTLWQVYGNVVDALATVAKRGAEVELAGYVNKVLSAGALYQFNFDTTNPWGKFQKDLSQQIYNKLLLKMDSYDTTKLQRVGAAIENHVVKNVTAETIDKILNSDQGAKKITQDFEAAKNLTKTVVVNQYGEITASSSGFEECVPISDFGLSTEGKWYVHIYVHKKENADETQYFQVIPQGGDNEKPQEKDKNVDSSTTDSEIDDDEDDTISYGED